ncbi:MAG: hypothetical protein KAJ19_29750, partial [Gammaproteobacteria bacterium]|nr:hypothetical protein [Gammaproteobacteria bacterium]
MPPTTYEEFQALPSSEKIGLVTLNSAKKQVVWSVVAGSIYDSDYVDAEKIVVVEDDGVALSEVFTSAVTAGQYYHDKSNDKIVLRLIDSSDPTDSFIAVVSRHFFSNTGVKAPNDLSTGFAVEWLPMLAATSLFTLQIDNQKTQLGSAIEGPGNVTLHNDQDFWKPRYDKFVFENQECSVYSWNRELAIAEARLLFRGKVQGKRYTPQ